MWPWLWKRSYGRTILFFFLKSFQMLVFFVLLLSVTYPSTLLDYRPTFFSPMSHPHSICSREEVNQLLIFRYVHSFSPFCCDITVCPSFVALSRHICRKCAHCCLVQINSVFILTSGVLKKTNYKPEMIDASVQGNECSNRRTLDLNDIRTYR